MPFGSWFKPQLFLLEEDLSLVVSDLERAAAWYREKFDCETRPKTDEDDGEWDDVEAVTVCMLGLGSIYLMKLVAGRDNGARSDGLSTVILCKDLIKGEEHLSARGVAVGATQEDSDGSRYFMIQDVDGNYLQVLEG